MPKLFCSFSKTWKYSNFPVKILKIKTNSCVDTQSKREFCKFLTQRHLYFSYIFCLDLFWKENIKIIGGALSTNKQRPVWFWKNRETTAWKDRIFIKYFIFFHLCEIWSVKWYTVKSEIFASWRVLVGHEKVAILEWILLFKRKT